MLWTLQYLKTQTTAKCVAQTPTKASDEHRR